MSESPYLLNNEHPETAGRFEGLEQTLRPGAPEDIHRFLELLMNPDTIIGTSVLITA